MQQTSMLTLKALSENGQLSVTMNLALFDNDYY